MPVNNTEPLSIYRAGPGYAPCLGSMILASSRGHRLRGFVDDILALPQPKTLRLLAALALHPAQLCGRIDNAVVALVDGVCSGMATARPSGLPDQFPFTPDALAQAATALGLSQDWLERTLERQRAFAAALAQALAAKQGAWLVEYLAVRYENRSAGVARGLVRRLAEDAGKKGAKALELFCGHGNQRAEKMCAALGFTPAGAGSASLRLMRLPL